MAGARDALPGRNGVLAGMEVDQICPLQESNLHLALRRGSFYPLN
jgi:hypothetical protein